MNDPQSVDNNLDKNFVNTFMKNRKTTNNCKLQVENLHN